MVALKGVRVGMKYYNNVLNDEELNFVNFITNKDRWGFGYISTDPGTPIWGFNKDEGRPVAELITSKLDGYELLEFQINGQTIGLHSAPHNDWDWEYKGKGYVPIPDGNSIKLVECTHVFIFFFQHWEYQWGGRLHIFEKNKPIVITPEKNTGVLFDASIKHYAEGPIKNNIMRKSIGIKLKKSE